MLCFTVLHEHAILKRKCQKKKCTIAAISSKFKHQPNTVDICFPIKATSVFPQAVRV